MIKSLSLFISEFPDFFLLDLDRKAGWGVSEEKAQSLFGASENGWKSRRHFYLPLSSFLPNPTLWEIKIQALGLLLCAFLAEPS